MVIDMQRYVLVNKKTGLVDDVTIWDGATDWSAPTGYEAIQSDTANIGDTYAGGTFSAPSVVSPKPEPVPLKIQAMAALPETDMVAFRCFKAGIPFPADWQTYTSGLRNLANGTDTTSTTLPSKPAYPAGT